MKIGLIGLNQTGKTSLFNLLTGKMTQGDGSAVSSGTCFIPDERIDFLSKLFDPKKTTYAKIDLTDVPGLSISSQGHNSAARFLGDVRNCDALIYVLRAFESSNVIHDMNSIDPVRDLEIINSEMLLADLEMIEKRIKRIKTGKKITKEHEIEIDLLERCFKHMENGGSVRDMTLTENEISTVRGFSFLTDKPLLIVVNLDESQWESKSYPGRNELITFFKESDNNDPDSNSRLIELCVKIELEINNLPNEDKQIFLDDLGITESGVSRLAKAAYELMNLISFLTYGTDEVKAWTIKAGTGARIAAGKIHSDIERGFIRAEVIKFSDLFKYGTIAKVKENGLFKLEGKNYIVEDGDLILFRFNV